MEFKNWYLFNDDPTMRWLERIFNGWYINENNEIIELNGIIQLFNCFYYMAPNRKNAIRQFTYNSKYVFNESSYFLDKPVYFGWGNLDSNVELRKIAKKIFTDYNREYTTIYNDGFENNKFYHPRYINCSYKKNEEVKRILRAFHKLIANS